jgi:hypothetical protein
VEWIFNGTVPWSLQAEYRCRLLTMSLLQNSLRCGDTTKHEERAVEPFLVQDMRSMEVFGSK